MPKQALDTLTESMFYVLMALYRGEKCGIDIAAWIEEKTSGRCRLGPATLYTILGKFEAEGYIAETAVEGRKRTYRITDAGQAAYSAELQRLHRCIHDAARSDRMTEESHEREQEPVRVSPAPLPVL